MCWWGEMRAAADAGCRAVPAVGRLSGRRAAARRHTHARQPRGGARVSRPLDGQLREPEVLQKIPYMEMKLRLPEHLLMRVDKLTMAHAVEARVPFLDHDVVDFATRLPPSYKLRDGVGKQVLKKAAEPYLDHDMIYRRKQGFGAPMEEWFREGDFGARCLAAFERSELRKEGFFDNGYFTDLLKRTDRRPRRLQLPALDGDERRAVARVLDRRPRGLSMSQTKLAKPHSMAYRIPFNRPTRTDLDLDYIRQALDSGKLAGDGPFTRRCQALLEKMLGAPRALLTTSCTDAIEMSALLREYPAG